ncbi:hypothetical protein [Massilia sp. erpn]|uniref:hypothetical protein n=1 Tax=Massilia sp. erpn TaxID=2738142 RepID=UPI002104F4CF|nr:hypothetical protein [Massilia sp. erpn]UTY59229.1 hypothetical protein HPQ68_19845 [Massilia sp. erpn]
MRRVLSFIFLALLASPSLAQVLLSSATEQDLDGKIEPPAGVVKLIIQDEQDDAAQLGECLQEKGLKKTAIGKFFMAKPVQLNDDGLTDYFVRPTLKPYCSAFYGAHLFRYWFVTSHRKNGKIFYKIILKSGGDEVRILSSVSSGYRDLELIGHNAVKEYTTTWNFDGKQYQNTRCSKRTFTADGGEVSAC